MKILLLLIQILAICLACPTGCNKCYLDFKGIERCSQCQIGFTYYEQTNICVQEKCELNQSYFIASQQKVCTSVCPKGQVLDSSNNKCLSVNSCSTQYLQQSQISNGQKIIDVSFDQNGYIQVIYNYFVNKIHAQDGSFIRQYSFNLSLMLIKCINQQIYLATNENKVYFWDQINQKNILCSVIQQGTINTQSDILVVSNNQSRSFITSFSQQQNKIFFTEINAANMELNQLEISFQSKFITINSFLVMFNSQNQILVYLLSQNVSSQVFLQQINQSYTCQLGSYKILQVESFLFNDQISILLVSQQQNKVFLLRQNSASCDSINTPFNQINKIQKYSVINSNNSSQILFILADNNSVQIVDLNTLQTLEQRQFSLSILDICQILIQNEMFLYILTNQKIEIYQFDYKVTKNLLFYNEVNVYINSPTKLVNLQNNQNQSFLCILSDIIQIVDLQLNKTYISTDFKAVSYQNHNTINQIALSDDENILVSCDQLGIIVIWQTTDLMNPKYLYQYSSGGYPCTDVQIFQSQILLVQFKSYILIQNIYSYFQMTQIFVNPQQYSQIQVSQNFIYLFFNQTLAIYNNNYQQIYANSFNSNVLNAKICNQDTIYTADSQNVIRQYIFNNITLSINQMPTNYQLQFNYSKMFLFNYPNQQILMVMDSRNQMSILNNNFQILLQNVQQYGMLIDVKMYQPNIFITLFYSSQQNLAYPCQFGYLEITQNGVIQRPITYSVVALKLSIVRKITEGNNQDIFLINGIIAFSYTLVGQVKWYKQSGVQLRGNQNYIISETATTEITNIQNTISYAGTMSGYFGVSPINQDYPIQKVYSLQKMYSQDTIQFIKRSFKLGSYYIIKIYSIQIFNLFSDQFIEQIQFDLKISDNPDSFEAIVDLMTSDNLEIILSFNRQQIIVKDQINNLNYTVKQSQVTTALDYVQGCYIDEAFSKIIAYGKFLVQFNLDLSNMINLSPAGHYSYEICFFMTQFVVCKININSISIYDKLNSYKVISKILIQDLINFTLQIDQKMQYIFAYQNTIEIYNFQGSYLSSVKGSDQNIFQFDICSNYLVAYTPSAAMIISRQTLQIVKNIIPSLGQLRKGFYFSQINLIAYLTNEITTGQIKFFSLNNLQQQGSVTQPFKPNGVGYSLDVKYDQESNVIFYVDVYGNSQIATLGSTVSNQNIIGISELQLQQTSPPIDYFLDFDMNEIFIHNGQYVWRQSYNIQTKVYQRIYQNEKKYHILIQSQQENVSNSVLVCDNSYNLFVYDQQKMVFIQRFQDQVIEMKQFLQFNQVINLAIFPSSVNVIIGYTNNLIPNINNTFYNLPQKIRQFLFVGEDVAAFLTQNNQFIDYDFVNQKYLFTFQFNQNYLIAATFNFTYLDNQNQKQNILLVSLSSGEIFQYNISQKKSQIISSYQPSNIVVKFIQKDNSQLVLIMSQGNIIQVETNTMQALSSQIYNQKAQSINQSQNQGKGSNIVLFNIDDKYQRYYISIADEKKLAVFNSINNNLIKYLAFPEQYWKKLYNTQSYLVLGCKFQLNFYNNSNLSYVGRFRKSGLIYSIKQFLSINKNSFAISYQNGIEIIVINTQNLIVSAHFKQLSFPEIISLNSLISSQVYQVLAITSTGIYEYRLSQGQINDQISNQNNGQSSCVYEILYQNSALTQNQLDQISLANIPNNINETIQISIIDQEFNFSNFQYNNQTKFIFSSANSTASNKSSIFLNQNSFLNINQDVNLIDLNLFFQQGQQLIKFNQNTQNINFQSLQVSNQTIYYGSQLIFNSTSSVQLVDMKLINLNLSSSQRLLANSNSQPIQQGLFVFENISYVLIDQMNIENMFQLDNNFALILASQIDTFIIKKLSIQNSYFNGNLIQLMDIQNLRLETIIIKNCQNIEQVTSPQQNQSVILQLLGIQQTFINNFISTQNKEIAILKSNKTFNNQNYIRNLFDDTFFLQNAFVSENKFPFTYKSKKQQNLFLISNTNITLSSMQFQQNEGNIQITNSTTINISQSNFQLNRGTDGASFYFKDIKQIQINSTIFFENTAFGNGGSLLCEDVQIINIDSTSQFIKNIAQIGGAIRIISVESNLNLLNPYGSIQATFEENVGKIYGNNIGTYPSKFSIQNSQLKDIYQASLFEEEKSNILYITDQQSGGSLYLSIKLYDSENKIVTISLNQIQSNSYPESIMNELSFYIFELTDASGRVEIRGQSIITYKQYNMESSSFIFDNIILASQPNILINSQILRIKLEQQKIIKNVNTQIKFRNCLPGEVFLEVSQNIIQCEQCAEGTYSLQQPVLTNLQELDSQKCKKCPYGVSKCHSNKLILSNGFWRENEDTDLIYECNQEYPDICNSQDKNSISGCTEGYLGPLCETCDIFGKIWKKGFYANSIQKYKCQKCSESKMEFVYIFVIAIFIFCYILANILMLMKNCIANVYGNYLRMMKLLPYSKSCIQDESVSIIPQMITYIFEFFGSPAQKLSASSECFYHYLDLGFNYIITHITFFFFQFDVLNYFISTFQCRQIGSKSYISPSLELQLRSSIKNLKLSKLNSEISKFQDHLKKGECLQDFTQEASRKRSISNAKKQSYILNNILHVTEQNTVRNKRQSIYNLLQSYQKTLNHENQTKFQVKKHQDKNVKFNIMDEEIKGSNDFKASQKQSCNMFDQQSEFSEHSRNQIYTINSVKQHTFSCQIGCLKCQITQNNQEQCIECNNGYQLNSSFQCIQTMCEIYEYAQINNQNQQQCVALCGDLQIGLQSSINICQNSYYCSSQFLQQTNLSRGQNVQNVVQAKNGQLLVIYTNFINLIDSKNASFIRCYSFDSNIILIQVVNNQIYLFSSNNTVFAWDLDLDKQSVITQIQSGQIDMRSRIIHAENNLSRIMIAVFHVQQNHVVLTDITSSSSSQQIIISYVQSAFLLEDYILLINQLNEMLIVSITENNNQQLTQNQISTNYFSCSNIGKSPNKMIKVNNTNSFYLIFNDSSGLNVIQQSNSTCVIIQSFLIPKQINQLLIEQNLTSNLNLIIALYSNNLFEIYESENQKTIFSRLLNDLFIDFYVEKINSTSYYSFLLKNNAIDVYILAFNILSDSISFTYIKSFPSQINNPLSLLWVSDPQNLSQSMSLLCVVSQDIQVIDVSGDKVIGLAMSFQEKVNYNNNTISSIAYSDQSNIILSCSFDGRIIAWQASNPLKPSFLYKLEYFPQYCLSSLNNQYIGAVLLQNTIVVFNIYNPQLKLEIQIKTQNYTQIFQSTSFSYCIYDQQISVFQDQTGILASIQGIDSIKKAYVSSQDQIYLIFSNSTINVYQFVSSQQQIILIQNMQPYQQLNRIAFSSFFNLPSQGIYMMIQDSLNSLNILDGQLNLAFNSLNLRGNLVDVYMYNQTTFFLLLRQKLNSTYPFTVQYLNLSGNPQILTIDNFANVQKISFVRQTIQKNFQLFRISIFQLVNSISTSMEIIWNVTSQTYTLERQIYTQNQMLQYELLNKQSTISFLGSQTGFVGTTTCSKNNPIQNIFNLTSYVQNSFDTIQQIKNSFRLGYLYVIAQTDIYRLNAFTYEFVDIISFNKQSQVPSNNEIIQQFGISDYLGISIAYNSQYIIVRDEINNKQNQLQLSSPNSQLQTIKNYYIDESAGKIYLYGNVVIQTDPNLQQIVVQSPQTHQNFQLCSFQANIVICQFNQNQIAIYNKVSPFIIINIIQPSIDNFSFQIDTKYSIIFTYSSNIEIYNLQGAYVTSINSIGSPIFQFDLCGDYILAYTSLTGFVISRISFTVINTFVPSGATLTKGFYFEEIQLIAYLTNEIRYGQVKFYDLKTQQSFGSVLSQYTNNGVGFPISVLYDAQTNAIHYVDNYGNSQIALYGPQIITSNMIGITQLQQQSTSIPVGFITDFNNNQEFVFNQNTIWTFSYNILTKSYQQLNQKTKQFFLTNPIDTVNDSISLLVCDGNNNIFFYQDYVLTFQQNLNNQVLDMRRFIQKGITITLIVYPNSLQIFKGQIQNLSVVDNANNYYLISNFYMKQIILIQGNTVLIQTISNQILDYDFTSNQVLYNIKLSQNDFIVSSSVIQDSSTFVFLTLNSGGAVKYDLDNKNHTILSFIDQNNPQNIGFSTVYSSQNEVAFTMRDGSIIQVEIDNLQIKQQQIINQNAQSIKNKVQDIKSIQIPILFIYNGVYLISISEEKKVGVFNQNSNSFVKYLSFPDEYNKQFLFTSRYLILYCSFQLNIYLSNTLQFISSFRKSNMVHQITQIVELQSNVLLVFYAIGIETIIVNEQLFSAKSINFVQLQMPQIIQTNINESLNMIQIVALTSQGIFDERISIDYLNGILNSQTSSGSLQSNGYVQNCYQEIEYKSSYYANNIFDYIYKFQYNHPISYQISLKMLNEIQSTSFLNQKSVSFSLKPSKLGSDNYNLTTTSFMNVGQNLQIDNFNLLFLEQQQQIQFSSETQNVTFQSLNIQNQEILYNTSIYFYNLSIVQIINLKIENVNLSDASSIQTGRRILQGNSNKIQESALLFFENCSYVLIDNLTVSSLILKSKAFKLIIAKNIQKMIIKNIRIENSQFNTDAIVTNQINNLLINNIQVFYTSQYIQQLSYIYILAIQGIQEVVIDQYIFNNNTQISALYSINQFNQINYMQQLINDNLYMVNCLFNNNTYSNIQGPDTQINLLFFQNSNMTFQGIKFLNNQGTIYIKNSGNLTLQTSLFESNIGVTGSSLYLDTVISAAIQYSSFKNNYASSLGGAIYCIEVANFTVDNNSLFTNNTALIGGAIKISIQQASSGGSISSFQNIKAKFQDNIGKIYGNNIGTYPKYIKVTQSQNEISYSDYRELYIGELAQSNPQKSQNSFKVNSLQSGANFYLTIIFFDQQNQMLTFDQSKLINGEYPQQIMDEVQNYYFSIDDQTQNSQLEIKGQQYISYKEYKQQSEGFTFDNIILASSPNSLVITPILTISFSSWSYQTKLQLELQFRGCKTGEIIQQISTFIYYCKECQSGTYSLQDPSNFSLAQYQTTKSSLQIGCKKCPVGALQCQSNQIILEKGYWRKNSQSDVIVQCNNLSDRCDPQNPNSIQGCQEGYIGPICQTCDTYGSIWRNKVFVMTMNPSVCEVCSQQEYQIVYIVLILTFIFIYINISVVIFMNSYSYNSVASYLRYMSILPLSNSCIQDQSTFIIKQLINFLQLSSILYQIDFNILPTFISLAPGFAGQPVGKMILSSGCIYKKLSETFHIHEEIKMRSLIYFGIPLVYFVVLLIQFSLFRIFRILKSQKYYKFIMVNILFFFFQPDAIQFFTSTFSCTQIGEENYLFQSLIISCDDSQFTLFRSYLILPSLFFWIFFPLVILFILIWKLKKKQKLFFCTMKFRFGYYILEYKEKYFYWEFIRIYYKIVIVLTSALLVQSKIIQECLSIILITLYISSIHAYTPFQSLQQKRNETTSQFILMCNLFFSIMQAQYQHWIFTLIIASMHYGFIFYFVYKIFKIKIMKYKNKIIKIISYFYKMQQSKPQINKLVILSYWKMIKLHLADFRGKYAIEQISSTNPKCIDNESTNRNNLSPLSSSNSSSPRYFISQIHQNDDILSYEDSIIQSDTKSAQQKFQITIFSEQSQSQNQNVKMLDVFSQVNTEEIKTQKTHENNKDMDFPLIYSYDMDEQVLPNILYKSQKAHAQNKNTTN
ncbi:hypothetical protein ABPG73_017099 [Tetrahymena malaccensis]